jgi:hypothetical protein
MACTAVGIDVVDTGVTVGIDGAVGVTTGGIDGAGAPPHPGGTGVPPSAA